MIVPGMANTPTQTSDVAMARLIGMPTNSVNPGTITMPPPMPSSPERPPAAAPTDANVTGDASPSAIPGAARGPTASDTAASPLGSRWIVAAVAGAVATR